MSALMQRLLKASTLEHASIMEKSTIYNEKEMVKTPIPALNIAYSADLDGGLSSGLHVWAGPSRHFKSLFCLISAASYLHKYPDAVCIFYDNEFGSPKEYFRSVGIDPARVLHSPFLTLEELRTDITNQLNAVKRGDKVIIVVDSLGLAASNKEVKDAEDGSEKADMTRAKVNKSLFRIVTPHLRIKDIPMLVVQHTYQTQEIYSKTVVSGGTGTMLAAENVYILGRQQEKETQTGPVVGYNFIINVEKSRYVKDKMKIPVLVRRTGGIARWGGLFDLAVEAGLIERVNQQSYAVYDPATGELISDKVKKKDIENDSKFWKKMTESAKFKAFIKDKYAVSTGALIKEDDDNEDSIEEDEEVALFGDPELEGNTAFTVDSN